MCDQVMEAIRQTTLSPGLAPSTLPAGSGLTQSVGGTFTASSSTVILAANAKRRYAKITNTNATLLLYISFDGTAATTSDFVIGPGQSIELEVNALGEIFDGEIRAIESGATVNIGVVEFEKA